MKSKIFILFLLAIIIALTVFLVLHANVTDEFEEKDLARLEPNISLPLENNDVTFEPNITEREDVGSFPPDPYDYSVPVAECEPVDVSHFNKAVFIGDSRMLGLIRYTDIEPINFCGVGFSVASYDTVTFVKSGEDNLTVRDALRELTDYDAVYISTGLNELGWASESFESEYSRMLDDISAVVRGRPIYVQLIMPVTTEFETSRIMNPYKLKNSNVEVFNNIIRKIAVKKQLYLLDCSDMFSLENNTLNPEFSSDGAHLTRKAYNTQLDYYRSHVIPSDMIEARYLSRGIKINLD